MLAGEASLLQLFCTHVTTRVTLLHIAYWSVSRTDLEQLCGSSLREKIELDTVVSDHAYSARVTNMIACKHRRLHVTTTNGA